jgi:hypothetical protein
MWETVAILVIFFFLLIGGITFYTRLQQASMKDEQKYYGQLNAIEITEVIQNLPELECPPTLQLDSCVDEVKIEVMTSLVGPSGVANLNIKNHYATIFGFSEVKVEKIVPVSKIWNIYNERRTEDLDNAKSSANIPVSIYDPIQNTFSFGVLTVNVYN